MFSDRRLANDLKWHFNKPLDWNMRVPDGVRKCVVFLGRVVPNKPERPVVFGGTGFFIMVQKGTIPDKLTCYLVTARHVAEQLALGEWVMRANTHDGKFFDRHGEPGDRWFFHPTDESTDVAVMPLAPPEGADFLTVPESMFLNDETIREEGIGAGDDVFMVGLFNRMCGRSRNQPIVRMGNVALIPDPGELVPLVKVREGVVADTEAYLIEARSLGGLSGSPAFVRTTVETDAKTWLHGLERPVTAQSPGPFYLLGLMNGHWAIHEEDVNEAAPRLRKQKDREAVNMGIAIVIPAKKIREVLYQPGLVEMRCASDQHDYVDGSSDLD